MIEIDNRDAFNDFEEESRRLGWIAARLAWHASDLAYLITVPAITKADLQVVHDEDDSTPKIVRIKQIVEEFVALFPDIKNLDDARRKFGAA